MQRLDEILKEIRKGQITLSSWGATIFVGRGLQDDDVKNIVDALIAREQLPERENNDIYFDPTTPSIKKKDEEITLDLSSNKITSAGIHHLTEILSKNKVNIVTLNLSDNDLSSNFDGTGGPDHYGMRHLAAALSSNRTVRNLHINNIKLNSHSMMYLGQLFAKNNTLEYISCANNRGVLAGSSEAGQMLVEGLKENTTLANIFFQDTLQPDDEQQLLNEIYRKASKIAAKNNPPKAEAPAASQIALLSLNPLSVLPKSSNETKIAKLFAEAHSRASNQGIYFNFIREKLVAYSGANVSNPFISFLAEKTIYRNKHHQHIVKDLLAKPEYQSFNKENLSQFFIELNGKLKDAKDTEVNPEGDLYAIIKFAEHALGLKPQALDGVCLRNNNNI